MAECNETYTLAGLIEAVRGLSRDRLLMTVAGDDQLTVGRFMPPDQAGSGDMAFLTDAAYADAMKASKADVLVMREKDAKALFGDAMPARTILLCEDPYAFFAFASQLLFKASATGGIDPRAFVDPTATVHPSATVQANASIGAGAVIGAGTVIKSGAVIAERVTIGENCIVYPNAVLERDTVVGDRCIFQPGCVIGGDGFGFAPFKGEWVKIPQVGRVVIGSDVEIGANTTVDRGALDDTVIGDGTKLDNLIQLGHNDKIGKHVVMAACVGIAGSTSIGDHTIVGGAAMVNGHINVPGGSLIGPGTAVTGWGKEPGQKMGFFPSMDARDFHVTAATIARLPTMRKDLRALSRQVKELDALIRNAED